MKNVIEYMNESTETLNNKNVKYMNKSQLYLLGIPYAMYKEYGQYKDDWESLSKDDINDLEDTQNYLDSLIDSNKVRKSYKSMPPYFQYGIKTICEIAIKHKEDYSKSDIILYKNILNEVS